MTVPRPGSPLVLVVDDEAAVRLVVQRNLTGHGYRVEAVADGRQAVEAFERAKPALVLLDLGLPGLDGFEVIRAIREQGATPPIIVLSVRGAERDKVQALDLGADDYLTKPFGVDELLARVRVALRHSASLTPGPQTTLRAGSLAIDFESRLITVEGREVHLTPTEFDLLQALARHPNRVLTDRMLLEQVWGGAEGAESHYLHVYVARLRKKLESDPQKPRYLITEPGVGYRLRVEEP